MRAHVPIKSPFSDRNVKKKFLSDNIFFVLETLHLAFRLDVFHKWRIFHGNEARMLFSRSILVYNYQTDMFYVLTLLKSLNNRIIQS